MYFFSCNKFCNNISVIIFIGEVVAFVKNIAAAVKVVGLISISSQ